MSDETWRLTVATHTKWGEYHRARAEMVNRWSWICCNISDSRRVRIERVTRMRLNMGAELVCVAGWGNS